MASPRVDPGASTPATEVTIRTRSPLETLDAARSVARRLASGDIVLLSGPLGAGKTVFAQGVAAGLGVTDTVTSPTYTIVNEYHGRLTLYHIDLYRIGSHREFELLGLDDLLYGDGVSLIEWPERANGEIDARAASITIGIEPDGARVITVPSRLLERST